MSLFIFPPSCFSLFFFSNPAATTDIYTLSLHDALPIYFLIFFGPFVLFSKMGRQTLQPGDANYEVKIEDVRDRKSTRLNSSHTVISYAVFCLKKKKKKKSTNNSIKN